MLFSFIEQLLENTTSVLYGQNPNVSQVPVYAHVTECGQKKFYVSYWLFFPFSQGKPICTLDMGVLGPLPLPVINNRCFGTLKEFGSHVGDWEHMSLMFDVSVNLINIITIIQDRIFRKLELSLIVLEVFGD